MASDPILFSLYLVSNRLQAHISGLQINNISTALIVVAGFSVSTNSLCADKNYILIDYRLPRLRESANPRLRTRTPTPAKISQR
jgi:hypothetical protein